MTTKFTKGGVLSSNQLEDISSKKWKKGGILSATQLNKLSSGKEDALIKSIPVKVINNSGGVVQIHYVNIADGKMSYKQLYQTADDTEEIIDCCIFDADHGMSAIPFTGSFANKGTNKIRLCKKTEKKIESRRWKSKWIGHQTIS